jgi:hypothetical protein
LPFLNGVPLLSKICLWFLQVLVLFIRYNIKGWCISCSEIWHIEL